MIEWEPEITDEERAATLAWLKALPPFDEADIEVGPYLEDTKRNAWLNDPRVD